MNNIYKTSMPIIGIIMMIAIFSCSKRHLEILPPEVKNEESNLISENIDTAYNVFSQINLDTGSRSKFHFDSPVKFNKSSRGWQGCPNIGYDKGTLYVGINCGAVGEGPGNYISISTSDETGQNWSDNSLIIAAESLEARTFEISFWKDKLSSLHMSWAYSENFWDGTKGGTWQVKIKKDKTGVVLTKPSLLFHGIMNVQPTVDTSKILFPVSGWNFTSNSVNNFPAFPTPAELNGAFVYKSTYDAKTKQITKPEKLSKLPTIYARTFDEHMLVDLGSDKYVCLTRTNANGLCMLRSNDGCKTWDVETPFTDLGDISESRFYFGRLKSGNLLLVVNNSKKREKLTAFLSKDNGKSWPHKLLIDSRENVSYPDVTQNGKNEICLVYDYTRYLLGHIIFAKFTEDNIVNGETGKVFKSFVSQIKP